MVLKSYWNYPLGGVLGSFVLKFTFTLHFGIIFRNLAVETDNLSLYYYIH